MSDFNNALKLGFDPDRRQAFEMVERRAVRVHASERRARAGTSFGAMRKSVIERSRFRRRVRSSRGRRIASPRCGVERRPAVATSLEHARFEIDIGYSRR